jgi:hypothetical protein
MDSKLLIDTADRVNRYAIFYTVAHSHIKALEFILILIKSNKSNNFLYQNTNNHFHYLLKNLTSSLAIQKSSLANENMLDIQIYTRIYTSSLYNVLCHMDVYGDTVIHAASIAGDEKILNVLLDAIGTYIKDTIQEVYRESLPPVVQRTDGEEEEEKEKGDDVIEEIPLYENTEQIYTTIMSYIINNQNQLGLSPGHLSAKSEILEILHNYHANLLIQDYQQR